ncbi:MAG: ergothioneine biosynthesis protein EgtB [Flammeovirgaceae bacterium]
MQLKQRYTKVRNQTELICEPLCPEDFVVQPMEDVSPPKWHLGHTTWFFETFILLPHAPAYQVFHPSFSFIFNSYYESVGERVIRANRGNLSRPTTDEIRAYRKHVDQAMSELLTGEVSEEVKSLLIVGLHHEQQHQELLVTDIKYILGNNPLFPVYRKNGHVAPTPSKQDWFTVEKGLYEIGYTGNDFHWDNEKGVHTVYLDEFTISNRLVTNGEFLEFVESGAYERFDLWLSEAWGWIQEEEIKAPMYWHQIDGKWHFFTMSGLEPLDLDAPVTHVSFFEADAYAGWKGYRLPSEAEWEVACKKFGQLDHPSNNYLDQGQYQPVAAGSNQFFGDCWEWTNSAYLPYPNYQKPNGALGEYNGKFMINQMVLRGGSCATPADHIRPTYRNFFPTNARWQFSGIRLAR